MHHKCLEGTNMKHKHIVVPGENANAGETLPEMENSKCTEATKKSTPAPMTITFVGAGNLASHLAPALADAGHQIVCVFSRTMASAERLSQRVGQGSAVTNDLACLKPADLYVISVTDTALADIVSTWPAHCCNGIVIHTSGSVPMSALQPTGSKYGALYPMQTFSKNKDLSFRDIPCFVEGNDEATFSRIKDVAASISNNVKALDSEGRRHLHMAAIFACNFTNHMVALAYEMLEQQHVEPECLLPLIDETCEKLHHLHPHDGQTGPARRCDEGIIKQHLETLKDNPELHNIYKIMSESISRRFKDTL